MRKNNRAGSIACRRGRAVDGAGSVRANTAAFSVLNALLFRTVAGHGSTVSTATDGGCRSPATSGLPRRVHPSSTTTSDSFIENTRLTVWRRELQN